MPLLSLSNHAVIFDMDGVICDTNPYHAMAWRSFLNDHHISATEEEFIAHMYGKSNSYILQYFFKREIVGAEFDRMEFEKELRFRQIYEHHAKPIAGLIDFIASLKQYQVKTGIATSAPIENMDLILSKVPIRQHMGSLLASHHVTHHKPHPEVYLTSAQNLGIAPSRCVVFEDSFSGVTAALRAGMKVVGVLTTYTPDELPPCHGYVNNYEGFSLETLQKIIET
ncbi:MAG: HAD family phosphatase [Spirosomataceae bacterium]